MSARDTLSKEFRTSVTAVSWVWSAYSIVFAAVLLTSGRLADRYGRRRIYTIGLVVFSGADVVRLPSAFCPTFVRGERHSG
jgi:MFS family permease